MKAKSDSFGKITTTDTEAKSEIKDLEHRKVVSWSYDVKRDAETCVERFFMRIGAQIRGLATTSVKLPV